MSDLSKMLARAKQIQSFYIKSNEDNGRDPWGITDYTSGLVGDVGDLTKLVMAKNNLRSGEKVDEKLKHELADVFWSLLVLSSELGVNLESAFYETMQEIEGRFQEI